jgi:hypothetical protein
MMEIILLPIGAAGGLVLALVPHWNPLAVLGGVALIHVDPLKRVSGPAWTHIGHKLHRVLPSSADFNSPAAVVLKTLISWVFASADSVIERFNRPSRVWVVGKPVRCLTHGKQLFLQAPATSGTGGLELATVSLALGPAITAAKPDNISGARPAYLAEHGQSSNHLARSVNWECH